jgi:hypothetical protein
VPLQFSSISLNKRTEKDPSTSKIGGHGNSSTFLPAHFLLHISLLRVYRNMNNVVNENMYTKLPNWRVQENNCDK